MNKFLVMILCFHLVNCAKYGKYCHLKCEIGYQNVSHTVCDRAAENCSASPKCGPDFKVIPLDNDDRQYILDIHNYCRNKVALGLEKRNKQPSASNMRILRYNRELEHIAQCWGNACNGKPLMHDRCRRTEQFQYVGQNLGYVDTSKPKIDKVSIIKDLILLWYDEVKFFDRSWINETVNRGKSAMVGHYTQMVWADTTDVGCSMTFYSRKSEIPGNNAKSFHVIFVCNYGPAGNFIGAPLYKIGSPLKECPKGTEDIGNSIYKGLCGRPISVEESQKIA